MVKTGNMGPEQVGDVNSNVKGSGARYNSGKPDLSQFNLKLIADTIFSMILIYGSIRCWLE